MAHRKSSPWFDQGNHNPNRYPFVSQMLSLVTGFSKERSSPDVLPGTVIASGKSWKGGWSDLKTPIRLHKGEWMNWPSSGTHWKVLVGICLLALMLASGSSPALAAEPPAPPPTVQEDKGKAEDADKIQERGVKRPTPKPRPPLEPSPTPPRTPPTPPGVPVPHPN